MAGYNHDSSHNKEFIKEEGNLRNWYFVLIGELVFGCIRIGSFDGIGSIRIGRFDWNLISLSYISGVLVETITFGELVALWTM